HWFERVADRGVVVAHDGSQGQGAFLDDGAQPAAADGGDVAAKELGDIGQVASHVCQGARTGPALVSPAHGCCGIESVVGPVAAAEVQDLAQDTGANQVADVGDAGGAAE